MNVLQQLSGIFDSSIVVKHVLTTMQTSLKIDKNNVLRTYCFHSDSVCVVCLQLWIE